MQILHKDVAKDGSGSIKVMVEQTDDLWHLYNLIAEGDLVRTGTERKVHKELASGASDSQRVKLNLTVKVEKVSFDAEASELRLSGRNVEENEWVKMGAFHTLELQLHRAVRLSKYVWDALALARLAEAADANKDADVAVLVMQAGVAHLCLITPALTLTRAKIIVPIPRKGRRGDGALGKSLDKFYEAMLSAVLRCVDFTVVKALLVGSPAFIADDFLAYVWAQAGRREDAKALFLHRSKFVRCRASCGFRHAVGEVLLDSETAALLSTTRAAAEVCALDALLQMMGRDANRAVYGFAHVRAACDNGACHSLLLSDALFRAQVTAVRRQYVDLVEDARAAGAQVFIFSAMHPSGEQLAQLSGVASLLRFPLDDSVLAETAAYRGAAADGSTAAADAAAALDAQFAGESSDDDGEGPLSLPGAGLFDAEFDRFR
ncbi:eRF1 domain 1-domain-containing protein [Pavlovales sp. CCMP2436]|nr:eRF1 domain 1-domain-containing protein [Pavlovales sp. CCMP2436]